MGWSCHASVLRDNTKSTAACNISCMRSLNYRYLFYSRQGGTGSVWKCGYVRLPEMTVVMLLTTPWSWSWWLKIVAWLQSTNCLCAWNTTVKLSSLHNCNLLWIKIRGKQSACICLILSTSLKTFRKAGFLARYLRVHACFSSGVQVPIPAWSIGDRRDSGW